MAVATVVASLIVAAVLAGSSATKLLGTNFSTDTATHLGYSLALNRFVGLCEAAAVVGLIAGLFWRPLAIAAAGGVVLLTIGALGFHRRAGDSLGRAAPALLVLILAAAVIVGHAWQLTR
jgi:DoxX-like family